jgi:hypothetical protein
VPDDILLVAPISATAHAGAEQPAIVAEASIADVAEAPPAIERAAGVELPSPNGLVAPVVTPAAIEVQEDFVTPTVLAAAAAIDPPLPRTEAEIAAPPAATTTSFAVRAAIEGSGLIMVETSREPAQALPPTTDEVAPPTQPRRRRPAVVATDEPLVMIETQR